MVYFLKFLSARLKRNKELGIAENPTTDVGNVLLNISPSSSPLLHEVLDESGSAEKTPVEQEVPEDLATSLSQKLSIGEKLGQSKRAILEQTEKLASLFDMETAEALSAIAAPLQKQICRIAFVGQMKAGKSSLINVLVEDAELLPADINPWTTVVTNLHFGVPETPTSGASFTFFSTDEWQRLSIGGRVRELTERLFPDFDWAALSDQIQTMRWRAEKKLGPRFEDLLGTEHHYPSLTPGLLNRYVGAGAPEGAEPTLPEGEFCDITKLANVFFDLGAFSFPTILIDTPGVNDPFLVRDEITRQNLEFADVCVVVLTARQPLSSADLNLLRMLRGLNKSRLIIFVNKIDEIEADTTVFQHVSNRIRTVLTEEFPSSYIPIVLGSALWANTAVVAAQKSMRRNPGPDQSSADTQFWPGSSEIVQQVTLDALFIKSGLPALALAISELMRDGPIAENIDQTALLLEAISLNAIACHSREIEVLQTFIREPDEAAKNLALLEGLCASLSTLLDEAAARFTQIIADETESIHRKLLEMVQDYTASLVADLTSNMDLSNVAQTDLRLRVALEGAFQSAFGHASQAMLSEQHRLHEEIRNLLERYDLRGKLQIPDSDKIAEYEAPSIAALSEPVSIGLTNSFAQLSARRLPPEELASLLSKVIGADFEPIIAKLASKAETALQSMSSALVDGAKLLTSRLLQTMCSRLAGILREVNEVSAGGKNAETQIQQMIDVAIQHKKSQIAVLHEIASLLASATIKEKGT